MLEWFGALDMMGQIFAAVAIPATVVLILQTVMLLFGFVGGGDSDSGDHGHDMGHDHDTGHDHHFDHDHEHDHDHDGGLRIFTVRAFVAFFSIFGWTGIVLKNGGLNNVLSFTFAFLAGLAAMLGMAYFFKAAMKLQDSGNIDYRNSIGKTGTVYIPIPPDRKGKGKITVIVQERFSEIEAVTDCDFQLKTGTEIVVTSVTNQNVACVVPKSNFK